MANPRFVLIIYTLATWVLTLTVMTDVICLTIDCREGIQHRTYVGFRAAMILNYCLSLYLVIETVRTLARTFDRAERQNLDVAEKVWLGSVAPPTSRWKDHKARDILHYQLKQSLSRRQ